MASLSDLIAWRDALQEARFRGLRRVRDSGGDEVEYKSDAEMAAALSAVESAIAVSNQVPPKTIYFRTCKGV